MLSIVKTYRGSVYFAYEAKLYVSLLHDAVQKGCPVTPHATLLPHTLPKCVWGDPLTAFGMARRKLKVRCAILVSDPQVSLSTTEVCVSQATVFRSRNKEYAQFVEMRAYRLPRNTLQKLQELHRALKDFRELKNGAGVFHYKVSALRLFGDSIPAKWQGLTLSRDYFNNSIEVLWHTKYFTITLAKFEGERVTVGVLAVRSV